jgi:hypothetical protein
MILYQRNNYVYYEDGSLKFWVPADYLQVIDIGIGEVRIWIYQHKTREHKTFVDQNYLITDVHDEDDNPYGTTVEDIMEGINKGISVTLKDKNGESIDVQNPLPTNGDSVYCKDLNLDVSSMGDFSGEPCDLFNDYLKENIAPSVGNGGVNPKSFTVAFLRPLVGSVFGLGSANHTISNAKLTLFGIAGEPLKVIDFSDDDTKRASILFRFEQQIFAGGWVQFFTDDEVGISGAGLTKSQTTSIEAINGLISIDNSTSEPLGIGGVFTGLSVDTLNYGMVVVSTKSNQISATDGLSIQFSTDNINWDHIDEFTIAANTGKTFTIQTVARYMRIVYTNGIVAQAWFRLQTAMKPVYVKPSTHRIADTLSGQDDAELVKSILSGEDHFNVFQNIRASEVGSLQVSDFLVEVGRGHIEGYSFVRKFGYNPAVTTATGHIYEWGGVAILARLYTFSADGVADIDRLSSDDSLDAGIEITIEGLDINGDEVSQTIALDGADAETPVALTTSLWRVNRAYNSDNQDLVGNIYIFVNGATTAGVPNDDTAVRGYISIGNGQTLQAIYTVPNGKTGYMYTLNTSIIKKQAAFATFTAQARQFGGVKRTQDIFGLSTTGTSKATDQNVLPVPHLARTDLIPLADPDSTIGFSVSFLLLLIDD